MIPRPLRLASAGRDVNPCPSRQAPARTKIRTQYCIISHMRIHELIWPEDRIEHIACHQITPEEVEEACFGRPLVQRAKSEGANPVYYVLGQTASGRYLFCVVIQLPDGKGYPVTARLMTHKEQRRFKQWRR